MEHRLNPTAGKDALCPVHYYPISTYLHFADFL